MSSKNKDRDNEKTNVKVSIICTVKNAEEHLLETLSSIAKQTIKDLEIVCVYAKSKDNTLKILEDFQKDDDRLKIYTQDRPGIGVAKNVGIEKATGEFITFLDGDDFYVDEDALEKMYNAAKEHDVKICGAFRTFLNQDGSIIPSKLHKGLLVGFPNGRLFSYRDTQYDYHFHSYIYDRNMIINSSARFAETKVYDDTHFHIRAMIEAEHFYIVPTTLYCYRLHEAYSWSSDSCVEALNNLIDQLQLTEKHDLKIGHFNTFQRISNEYGPMFKKYLDEGDSKILKLLLKAQENVNQYYIDYIVNNVPDSNIIVPMDYPNLEVKKWNVDNEEKYVLSPLLDYLDAKEIKVVNISSNRQGFRSTKLWKIIVWVPKKVLRLLKLR